MDFHREADDHGKTPNRLWRQYSLAVSRMPPDGYVIRPATPLDVAVLPSVERGAIRVFENWLAQTGLTLEILERVSTVEEFEEARQRGHLWVAESSDGSPIGFALAIILGEALHLNEIDVVPEHGRRGVGTELVNTVCRWARDAGFTKVTLSTFRDVPWNAPFYQKCGFRVIAPEFLSPQHVVLVASERASGLRTDLRVVMQRTCEP